MNIKMTCGILVGSMLLQACGNNDGGSGSQNEQDGVSAPGEYRVIFQPINDTKMTNKISGVADIVMDETSLDARVNVINVPRAHHFQSVSLGEKCPTAESDSNQDGYVDVMEGSKAYGKFLVPLDADLSAQQAGIESLPSSLQSGTYTYQESADLSQILADLEAADEDPNDLIVKRNGLPLDGKVMVILGVSESMNLPETVAAMPGKSNEASLPIACGKIVRINEE